MKDENKVNSSIRCEVKSSLYEGMQGGAKV